MNISELPWVDRYVVHKGFETIERLARNPATGPNFMVQLFRSLKYEEIHWPDGAIEFVSPSGLHFKFTWENKDV